MHLIALNKYWRCNWIKARRDLSSFFPRNHWQTIGVSVKCSFISNSRKPIGNKNLLPLPGNDIYLACYVFFEVFSILCIRFLMRKVSFMFWMKTKFCKFDIRCDMIDWICWIDISHILTFKFVWQNIYCTFIHSKQWIFLLNQMGAFEKILCH